ncbi:hypothetical protein [Polynucleobacter sp. AP-Ainpum-60-G11]|jgi:hypothetical protein|uniref:hypothetical protein n=1 Tax=Polynucleobacter sp. AP-Ainpum-60-G11 TaxID=2576926 RepID=UPI001BFDCD6A|nr:hypothetical protein [Polynucleobacter sp. AP-Ainpum-60-G11]QWE27202.1 hypothetical protein FD971_02610 [Polynucleobacter sp. AP-Ainpum-60-G11]
MTPIEKERYIECIQRAKILSNASELYLKAAQVIEAGASEDERYRHIKSAKDLIEDAFPEVFEVRHPAPKYVIKEERDYKVLKMLGLAALILGVCYSFVVFGPTGDLSKTWTADDVAKSTAYPKQRN